MLYTKFQGSQFLGLEKQICKWFLPDMGLVATLVNRLEPYEHAFVPRNQKSFQDEVAKMLRNAEVKQGK